MNDNYYKKQIEQILYYARQDGYTDGHEAAKQKYGAHQRGIAKCTMATPEEVERWGTDLAGWCTECNKPINGSWSGIINFCPWCGRVIEWERKESET